MGKVTLYHPIIGERSFNENVVSRILANGHGWTDKPIKGEVKSTADSQGTDTSPLSQNDQDNAESFNGDTDKGEGQTSTEGASDPESDQA